MIVQGLDHVSVTVADLDRSLQFYHQHLGIPLLGEGEDDGPPVPGPNGPTRSRFRFADLDLGGGQILELLQYLVPKREPLHPSVFAPGGGHIGVRVQNLSDVLVRLEQAGVFPNFDPVSVEAPAWWAGATVVYVTDPDGTTVELVQRPGSVSAARQPRVRSKKVGQKSARIRP